jgi:hypothetical protein
LPKLCIHVSRWSERSALALGWPRLLKHTILALPSSFDTFHTPCQRMFEHHWMLRYTRLAVWECHGTHLVDDRQSMGPPGLRALLGLLVLALLPVLSPASSWRRKAIVMREVQYLAICSTRKSRHEICNSDSASEPREREREEVGIPRRADSTGQMKLLRWVLAVTSNSQPHHSATNSFLWGA